MKEGEKEYVRPDKSQRKLNLIPHFLQHLIKDGLTKLSI